MNSYSDLLFGPLGDVKQLLQAVLFIWSICWKGFGLWRSAKNEKKYWFIAIFLLNTVGILPIIYLAFFQKKGKGSKKK